MPPRCYIITDQQTSIEDIWQAVAGCDSTFALSRDSSTIYITCFDYDSESSLGYLNLKEVDPEDDSDFLRLLYADASLGGKSRAYYCWFKWYRHEPGGNLIFPWVIECLSKRPVKVLVGFQSVFSGEDFLNKVRRHPTWDWNIKPPPE